MANQVPEHKQMESMDKHDFDLYRRKYAPTGEPSFETIVKREPGHGSFENYAALSSRGPGGRYETYTDQVHSRSQESSSVSIASSSRTNNSENSVLGGNIFENMKNLQLQPTQETVTSPSLKANLQVRKPNMANPNVPDGADSDSDDYDDALGREMATERAVFHAEAWTDAMASENWTAAADHAKVLSQSNTTLFPETKAIIDITPVVVDLVSGYPGSAMQRLNAMENDKSSIQLCARVVACIRVEDLDSAKKWCNRYIRELREKKHSLSPAFFLMTKILEMKGDVAEAMFYRSRLGSEPPFQQGNKWATTALDVARMDIAQLAPEPKSDPPPVPPPPPTDTSIPISAYEDLRKRYQNVKRLYFDQQFKLHGLEDQIRALNPENRPVLPLEELILDVPADFSDPREGGSFFGTFNRTRLMEYLARVFESSPVLRMDKRLITVFAKERVVFPFTTDIRMHVLRLAAWHIHPDSEAMIEAIEKSRSHPDHRSIDINAPYVEFGMSSALHIAAMKENVAAIRALIKCQDIDLSIRSSELNHRYASGLTISSLATPLHVACDNNRGHEVVELLINAGANVTPGRDAQHLMYRAIRNEAVSVENFGILDVLVRAGLNFQDIAWELGTGPTEYSTQRIEALLVKLGEVTPKPEVQDVYRY